MKKIILGLALMASSLVFAAPQSIIFPQVMNFGNQVQVQIHNHTPRNVTCSGWINMSFQSGRGDSIHFHEMIWSRQSRFRTIYPRNFNDRIMHVHHSIFCR